MNTSTLLEQEYDFSNFDQKANSTTSNTSTGTITTPPKSGGDADAAKRAKDAAALKAKQDAERKAKSGDTSLRSQLVSIRGIFNKFTPNAIAFLRNFGIETLATNYDEDKMIKLIMEYIIRENDAVMKSNCKYIDWVLRLTTPGSPPYNLALKHQKQYDYVLTRNGKFGITLQSILALPKDRSLKNLNSIFYPQSKIGKGLDISSDEMASLRTDLDPVIIFNRDNTTSEFNYQMPAEEMHKIIMGFYTNEMYGVIAPQYKTRFY